MRFHNLACDYDGTLAWDGRVEQQTLDALRCLKNSGRHLILVTGRRLSDLLNTFSETKLFDMVVVENGAVLVDPNSGKETPLCSAPPVAFAKELARRGVAPLETGRIIISTWQPHENAVLETVRDLGLELQVIFNKGAVMVLPSGINKAFGLKSALRALNLSEHNTVGIGDAENDHSFMEYCEAAVAVENALPMVKETSDWVTQGVHGFGVIELASHLMDDDLVTMEDRLVRRRLNLGSKADGSPMLVNPGRGNILIAGTSGGGKSTLVQSLIELLTENGYQYCLIDPEGDHTELDQTVILGNEKHVPSHPEIVTALTPSRQNISVNLVGLPLADRPSFCEKLLQDLIELRKRIGHPHWIIFDETHHLLPCHHENETTIPPEAFVDSFLFVTVEPAHITRKVLRAIDTLLAIGETPDRTIANFCEALGEAIPPIPDVKLEPGDVIAWRRLLKQAPFWFQSNPPKQSRRRHSRKYAEGDVGKNAFIFTGPDNRLHLHAQNLLLFMQMAEGVDDLTWNFHLRRGDFENWFRYIVKDENLAHFAAEMAHQANGDPSAQRPLLRKQIQDHYTAAT